MPEPDGIRRLILGTLVVLVVTLTALSTGHGAKATDNGPRPRPDYASKEAFKLECELLGGTFTEAAGYTYCHHDGGTVQCDGNGKNCTSHPLSWQPQPGGGNVYDGSVDQVSISDDDQEPKTKAKGKQGKKHRPGRNARK